MDLLSIIIVNYRSGQLIIDSVRSIYQCNIFDGEIIVVDNASEDDSREKIVAAFPQVKWIQLSYNSGFARANNAGMKAAKGNTYLLLNPDTIALDDSITQCFNRLKGSDYAATGIQLLNAALQPQISGSYFVKGGLNHLLPIPYWGAFIRWIGYRSKAKVPGIQNVQAIEEVDWISGAFLMVKKEAAEKAGLLDEDFFLYAEEVEWCSRLKKVDKLALFGDLKIVHLEGGTVDKIQEIKEKGYYNLYDKKGLQLMVSNHLRVRKQYGIGWFLLLLLNYSFGCVVMWFAGTLHYLFTLRNPINLWRKAAAFTGNMFRLWILSPTIIRNKPHFYKML